MGARKPTPPPAGPTCPGCQAQAAKLTHLERQQRKQAKEIRQLQGLLYEKDQQVAEARELARRLDEALSFHRFTQPYLLHLFGIHLPEGNGLVAGLSHLN
jgi:hypothetical protein